MSGLQISASEMARGVGDDPDAGRAPASDDKAVVRKHGPALPADLAHELSDEDFYRSVFSMWVGVGCCCGKADKWVRGTIIA